MQKYYNRLKFAENVPDLAQSIRSVHFSVWFRLCLACCVVLHPWMPDTEDILFERVAGLIPCILFLPSFATT